jgi:Flp pilus assembly secretin CpaC
MESASISGTDQNMTVQMSKSLLVRLARPARRVSVGDPEIAEIVLVSPSEVLVNGRKPGQTSLIFWDQAGVPEIHNLAVVEHADRQVLLEVTVAELNRTAMERHGVDYRVLRNDLGLVFNPAKIAPLLGTFPTTPPNPLFQLQTGDEVTLGVLDPKRDIAAFFEFIQREGLGKILAEPHLVARSGQEAKFLSGGEIPIVIAEALQTSIVFKEFGTRVRFKPTVRDDDTIDLEVMPEVSEPDFANGVTQFGFRVPAFVTRRAETRVMLKAGETLVIAGLFRDIRSENEQKVPYLGDIPLVGYLFKRTTYDRTKNELMIVVKPRLVRGFPNGTTVDIPNRGPLYRDEVRTRGTNAPVTRPRLEQLFDHEPTSPEPESRIGSPPQRLARAERWTVQVASVPNEQAGTTMVNALKRRGYDAYLTSKDQGNDTLYRVRVGHYPSVDEAKAVAAKARREPELAKAYVVSE